MFFVISTNNEFPSQISAIISEKLSFLFGTPYLKKFSLWHRCQIKLINILIPHLDVSIILMLFFLMFIICFLVPNLFKKLLEVVKRSRQSADLCLLITKHIFKNLYIEFKIGFLLFRNLPILFCIFKPFRE